MAAGRLLLQGRGRRRIEAQRMGKLRQVDPLGPRHGLVGPDDRERQRVEIAALGVGGHAGDDLR